MSYELFMFIEIILTFKSVFAENAHIGIVAESANIINKLGKGPAPHGKGVAIIIGITWCRAPPEFILTHLFYLSFQRIALGVPEPRVLLCGSH